MTLVQVYNTTHSHPQILINNSNHNQCSKTRKTCSTAGLYLRNNPKHIDVKSNTKTPAFLKTRAAYRSILINFNLLVEELKNQRLVKAT